MDGHNECQAQALVRLCHATRIDGIDRYNMMIREMMMSAINECVRRISL